MIDITDLFSVLEVEKYTLHGLASVQDLEDFLSNERVETEEYDCGLVVYVSKNGFEEVHVAFYPHAWGRTVAYILAESFSKKMRQGVVLSAREQEGYWRSRPPKSHGWKVNGDFEASDHPLRLRQWILTPNAWYSSPVGRKYNEHHCRYLRG